MNQQNQNKECKKGRLFTHRNGKTYIVHSEDGCFYGHGSVQIFGRFGAQTVRDGKAFGPMRKMLIANVKTWI